MREPYNIGDAFIVPDENDYYVDIVRPVFDGHYQVFINALHKEPSRDTQPIIGLHEYCYGIYTELYIIEANSIYHALSRALDENDDLVDPEYS